MTTLVTASTLRDVPKGKHMVQVLNEHGDTTTLFDPTDEKETAKAREDFERALGRGSVGYALHKDGGSVQASTTRTFDATAEKQIVAPSLVGG